MTLGTFVALALCAAPADPVAIEVDGTALTLADARLAVQTARATSQVRTLDQVVSLLKAELLVVADVRKSGLAAEPETLARLEVERNRALAQIFVDQELTRGIKPTDEQLKEFYHRANDSVRVRIVVFASEGEAKASVSRLASGGPFAAELAKSVVNVAGTADGTTRPSTRGDLDPAISAVAFEAPTGKVLGPLQLREGWGVISVVSRTIASESAFASERERLADYWTTQTALAVKGHYLESLRKKDPVAIDKPFLQSIGTRVNVTPKEGEHVLARIGQKEIRYRDVLSLIRPLARSGEGGHMTGPVVKEMAISDYLDAVLLAKAATDNGLTKDANVLRKLARVQSRTLAAVGVEKFLAGLPANMPGPKRQEALDKRVAALEKTYRVRVNEAVLRDAL